MNLVNYIATYVYGSRSGLRHGRALALLIAASMITAACTGAFPEIKIDPEILVSPNQHDLGIPLAESTELLGAPAASLEDASFADESRPASRTSEAAVLPQQADVGATAGSTADETASVDVGSSGAVGLSVFERLNPNGPKLLDPREFDQRLPLDAIKPIYEPLVGSPDEVELDADELVMGVSINGESRAYPIRVLRFREMVNDELGGTPILVTW